VIVPAATITTVPMYGDRAIVVVVSSPSRPTPGSPLASRNRNSGEGGELTDHRPGGRGIRSGSDVRQSQGAPAARDTVTWSLPSPLPRHVAELIAARFAAFADPLRLQILDELRREGELSVGELVERLAATQQNVSKHLSVLLQRGVVSRRKQGTRALYRIADPYVLEMCELVCGSLQREIDALVRLVAGESPDVAGSSTATRRRLAGRPAPRANGEQPPAGGGRR